MRALLLRWLVLLCCLLVPATVGAIPVGELTDAAGERVGLRDIPDWGDTPGKIHRRYCAERATLPAIWASTLTPNGIVNDRRMPAGEMLEVRCTELRAAWKELPVFSALPVKELVAVKAELAEVKAELVEAKAELVVLGSEMRRLITEAQAQPEAQPLSSPSVSQLPEWWRDYQLWIVVLLAVLLVTMVALLSVLLRQKRVQKIVVADERAGAPLASVMVNGQHSLQIGGGVWSEQIDAESTRLFILVWDSNTGGLRFFRYLVTRQPDGSYLDVSQRQWMNIADLGRHMCEVMGRYVEQPRNTKFPFERGAVDQAKKTNLLTEVDLAPWR